MRHLILLILHLFFVTGDVKDERLPDAPEREPAIIFENKRLSPCF